MTFQVLSEFPWSSTKFPDFSLTWKEFAQLLSENLPKSDPEIDADWFHVFLASSQVNPLKQKMATSIVQPYFYMHHKPAFFCFYFGAV